MDTEGLFRELKVDLEQRILASTSTGDRSSSAATPSCAEECLKNVAEGEPCAIATHGRATGVIHPTLLRVGEHLVRLGDLLEPLSSRLACNIGMVGAGQLAVGLLNLVGARIALDAKDLVEVSHRWGSLPGAGCRC